jgi:hypothetical protein
MPKRAKKFTIVITRPVRVIQKALCWFARMNRAMTMKAASTKKLKEKHA